MQIVAFCKHYSMTNMFLQVSTTYGCLHYSLLLLMKATAGCSNILKDHCGLQFMNSHNMSLPIVTQCFTADIMLAAEREVSQEKHMPLD